MPKQIALRHNRTWRYPPLVSSGCNLRGSRWSQWRCCDWRVDMADETPVSSAHGGGDQLGAGGGEVALIRATGALRAIRHLRLNRVHSRSSDATSCVTRDASSRCRNHRMPAGAQRSACEHFERPDGEGVAAAGASQEGATPKTGAVRGTHVAPLGTLALRAGRRVRIFFAPAAFIGTARRAERPIKPTRRGSRNSPPPRPIRPPMPPINRAQPRAIAIVRQPATDRATGGGTEIVMRRLIRYGDTL
jgi:hypothetical protein